LLINFTEINELYYSTDVEQDISDYDAKNTEFHLNISEFDTITILVYTEDVKEDIINTIAYVEEDGDETTDSPQIWEFHFRTTINHTTNPSSKNNNSHEAIPTFLIIAGSASLFVIMISSVYYIKEGTLPLPFIRVYSKLKKEKIFENPGRKIIYDILITNERPMRLTDIQKEGAKHDKRFKNKSYVHYQLRRLEEFGYVGHRDTGNGLYYPSEPKKLTEEEKQRLDCLKQKEAYERYYTAHKDKRREYRKQYYAKNRERIQKHNREYYHKKKE